LGIKSFPIPLTGGTHAFAIFLAKVVHSVAGQDFLASLDWLGDFELDGEAFPEQYGVVVTVVIDEAGGPAEHLEFSPRVNDVREVGALARSSAAGWVRLRR